MEKPKLFFGLKRSKISHDEKILSFTHQKVDMPLKFSLKHNVKQIFNQGDINSCNDEKYRNAQMTETKFKIGDKVRYRLKRKTFEKGSSPSWSKTIHKVIAVIEHSYILDNSKRYLYYDLQRS